MQVENGYPQKRFGFYKVLWKIEHFFLLTCKNNWLISSPEFSTRDPFYTKWKLILKARPNGKKYDDYFLCASLGRLESDTGPEFVRANWKISLLNGNTNEYGFFENENCFGINMSYSVDMLSMNDVLNELKPLETDIMYLQCLLIINHKKRKAFSISTEQGISSLSENLFKLYLSRTISDVVLNFKDEPILAHKAVLHARNNTFASFFASRPESNSFDLFFSNQVSSETVFHNLTLSSWALKKIIAYLYSGDLDLVISEPSVSIYECALLLDIAEVIDYYIPDELTIHSTVRVGELVFVWIIKDFELVDQQCISSPPLIEEASQTIWRLSFSPHRDQQAFASIFAENIEGTQPRDVCLEFAVMDLNRVIFNRRRLQKSANHGGMLGFPNFMTRECLNNILDKYRTLRITFKLRVSISQPTSSLLSSLVFAVTPKTKEQALKLLSRDMASLFNEKKYSDATIQCKGKNFSVHKFIFASGSDSFSKMLWDEFRTKNEFEVSSLKPEILRIMLLYVYSGTVPNSSDDVIREVYNNAEAYHMFGLMNKCLQKFNGRRN